jgi:uncharacterized protein (DUF2141 family)
VKNLSTPERRSRKLFPALVLAVTGATAATTAAAATLTVTVSNIQSDVGAMNFAVYDNEDNWLGDNTVDKMSVRVSESMQGDVISVQFELAPGNYAVSVAHDDNDNGKMDTNFIGIPKEPTGLSNGAVAKFGPPKYKDAVFSLGEPGLEMPIQLVD